MNNRNKALQFKSALAYILLFLGLQLLCSTIAYSVAGMFLDEAGVEAFSKEYGTILLIASEVLTFAALTVIRKLQKTSFEEFIGDDKPFCINMILPMVIAGISGNAFTTSVMNILPFSQKTVDNYANSVSALNSSFILADLLAVSLLAPIIEELIFRGLALSRLKKALPIWAAVALQAVIFGIIHGDFLWVIYATTFGAILGYVRIKTGTIKASILLHIAFNASSFIMAILFMTAPETFATQAGIAMISGAIMLMALGTLKKYDNKTDV